MSPVVWGEEDTVENRENTFPHFSNFAQAGVKRSTDWTGSLKKQTNKKHRAFHLEPQGKKEAN